MRKLCRLKSNRVCRVGLDFYLHLEVTKDKHLCLFALNSQITFLYMSHKAVKVLSDFSTLRPGFKKVHLQDPCGRSAKTMRNVRLHTEAFPCGRTSDPQVVPMTLKLKHTGFLFFRKQKQVQVPTIQHLDQGRVDGSLFILVELGLLLLGIELELKFLVILIP